MQNARSVPPSGTCVANAGERQCPVWAPLPWRKYVDVNSPSPGGEGARG
jgi:hypothetical protein